MNTEQLARLLAELSPGGHVARVRRLTGGLSARTDALAIVTATGETCRLVLRRYPATDPDAGVAAATRLWRTLTALETLAVPAPRPVWLDAEASVFGVPSLVMTRIGGRSLLNPRDLDAWTRELARALALLHRTPLTGADLSFLPQRGQMADRQLRESLERQAESGQPAQGRAAVEALLRLQPRLRKATPVLVHGDYWAGNTIWRRGKVAAIVDWDDAAIDDPGADVGYCRMDLAMLAGPPAPDLFLDAYEEASGRRVPQLAFWDLLGAVRALPDPARWLPGYHELGRREITAGQMRERLARFIDDCLRRAA